MRQMSRPMAIKAWLELNSTPVNSSDLMSFIKSLNTAEKEEYARVAAEELSKATGEEIQIAAA